MQSGTAQKEKGLHSSNFTVFIETSDLCVPKTLDGVIKKKKKTHTQADEYTLTQQNRIHVTCCNL